MEKQLDDAYFAATAAQAKREPETLDEKLAPGSSIISAGDHDHHDPDTPTLEEMHELRHIADKINWGTYLIAFVELAERFSFYGSTAVFVNFIQRPLPAGSTTGAGGADGTSGALDMGQRASTGLTTFFNLWCYVTPLFGAYIADTYWGRYKTICWSVAIAMLGHVILIISGLPPVLEHHDGAFAALIIAMLVMGAGTGGFKSNISPLVADQMSNSKTHIITLGSGERVVVDPAVTVSRIYLYFYLFINVGALIGQIGMTYAEKYVGYWLAFTLPTIVFFLCPIVLLIGRKRYVRPAPTGSVLGKSLHLLAYASRGRWSINPLTTWKNMTAADFWENAKPSKIPGGKPAWMTFDDAWVDEVRRGFKACAVFVYYPLYWLAYNQMVNNLTSQAATMVTNGVPNDVINNLDPFALIIFIPICDLFFYPFLARIGIKFTPLKRIFWGFMTGSAAMIWATVTQYYIYKRNPCGQYVSSCVDDAGNAITSDINVWSQTGAYVLIAFSEIFASITGLEYAFTKAPKNMKSLVMSVFLFTSAISYALEEAFVSVSADPLLIWNYGAMAVLAFVGGIAFWITFRKLDAEEDKLNNLQEGHYVATKHVPKHQTETASDV